MNSTISTIQQFNNPTIQQSNNPTIQQYLYHNSLNDWKFIFKGNVNSF